MMKSKKGDYRNQIVSTPGFEVTGNNSGVQE